LGLQTEGKDSSFHSLDDQPCPGYVLSDTCDIHYRVAHFHPFPFYDPTLLRIYRSGALLSLGGIILGLFGIRRANSTRWHGPASAFAMLFFWIVAASGE